MRTFQPRYESPKPSARRQFIWISFEEIRFPVAPWQRLTAFSVMDQLTERGLLNDSDLLKAFAA